MSYARHGMLQLPAELLQHILSCLPDPRSLFFAIQSSRVLYLNFLDNEKRIITRVLSNYFGPGLLLQAKLTWRCTPPVLSTKISELDELDDDLQDELNTYVESFLRPDQWESNSTLLSWTLRDALAMHSFHADVILPLKDRFIQWSSDPSSCAISEAVNKSFEVCPVSDLEAERICRSLYRFELFRRLFGCFAWRLDELVELAVPFFSKFSPWEIAQLGCMHDFLGQQVAIVYSDVARHDITWGEFCVHFDADPADGTIQHLLTLGLAKILAIARLQEADYSEREKLFAPDDNLPRQNDDFLISTLIEMNEVVRRTRDENLYNTVLSIRNSHDDSDPGPETIWRLSCPEDESTIALFELHDWISRRWGYVLWDHARLQYLDRCGAVHLSPPWEAADGPPPESPTPRYRVLEASWQARSSLYGRGGRGWWEEGDETRVRWPEEGTPSQEEQRVQKEKDDKLRHQLQSLNDSRTYWVAGLML